MPKNTDWYMESTCALTEEQKNELKASIAKAEEQVKAQERRKNWKLWDVVKSPSGMLYVKTSQTYWYESTGDYRILESDLAIADGTFLYNVMDIVSEKEPIIIKLGMQIASLMASHYADSGSYEINSVVKKAKEALRVYQENKKC